jgi:hypothetical protein
MLRKRKVVVPQAPEARTVDARVMNGGGVAESVPIDALFFDASLYRSPLEADASYGWLMAVKQGRTVPFTPNVFRLHNGKYSVLGWAC